MTDTWLRWSVQITAQLVILAGLYWNRRQNRREARQRPVSAMPMADRRTLARIEKKVDDMTKILMRHLQSHAAGRR